MKHSNIPSPSRYHFLLKAALLTAVVTSSGGLNLQAESAPAGGSPDNLASEKNGAFVSYSVPLKGGTPPNALVNGQPNSQLSFAKHGGTHIIVIDLGKPSKLNTVQLKFSHPSQTKVYVLKKKPDGTNWDQTLAGLSPDAVLASSGVPAHLNGAEGEFIVLVCPNDPGLFSNFYVTGFHLGDQNHQWGYYQNHGEGNGGSLGEVPLPSSAYGDHNHPQPPSVPPESH
jgi:hypothetical protein